MTTKNLYQTVSFGRDKQLGVSSAPVETPTTVQRARATYVVICVDCATDSGV